jgi:hypothetical protein
MAIFDFKSRFLRPLTSATPVESRVTSSPQPSCDSIAFEPAAASTDAIAEQEKGEKSGKQGAHPHAIPEVSKPE